MKAAPTRLPKGWRIVKADKWGGTLVKKSDLCFTGIKWRLVVNWGYVSFMTIARRIRRKNK